MSTQTVLELTPTPRHSRRSEGTFATLADGRIVFIYSRFAVSSGDHGHAQLCSRHSDDGGRTWSQRDRVVVEQEGDLNVMSPSLLRLQDGRIALLYCRKDQARQGVLCTPRIRFSSDELKSLTRPRKVAAIGAYYVVNNDRMIQLRSGRLVVPMALHRYRGPYHDVPGGYYFSRAAMILFGLSDDVGRTWYESDHALYRGFPDRTGLQEPGVVELADGRIWCYARTAHVEAGDGSPRQWQTFSADGGLTWSPIEPSPFHSPCSPMSVKRHPVTGALFAVWNDHSGRHIKRKPRPSSKGRTPLLMARSRDDGRT